METVVILRQLVEKLYGSKARQAWVIREAS